MKIASTPLHTTPKRSNEVDETFSKHFDNAKLHELGLYQQMLEMA